MKKYLNSFAMFAALVTVFMLSFAANNITLNEDGRSGGNRMFTWTVVLDSSDTDTSAIFDLNRWDHVAWSTYPFRYSYTITPSDTTDSLNIKWYVDGSIDGTTWSRVDTLISLTASTFMDTTLSTTANLNNYKWPYYRMMASEAAKNGNDTTYTVTLKFWAYQDN
jgi:hypothetical protein